MKQIHSNLDNDEQHLVDILDRFQPSLSTQFHSRMRDAPWQVKPRYLSRFPLIFRRMLQQPYFPVVAAIFFFVFVLSTSFALSTSIRAAAKQLMIYFLPESADQLDLIVMIPSSSSSPVISSRSDFNLTPAQAMQQAGYEILEINLPNAGLSLVGAQFYPQNHAITLLYEGEGYRLYLTQRQQSRMADVFSIGASASVEHLVLRNQQAEYVSGGWKLVTPLSIEAQQKPGTQVNLEAVWDPSLPQQTLRWWENGIIVELRTNGSRSPDKNSLLDLAEGLEIK
jgi:hypothetical protein